MSSSTTTLLALVKGRRSGQTAMGGREGGRWSLAQTNNLLLDGADQGDFQVARADHAESAGCHDVEVEELVVNCWWW